MPPESVHDLVRAELERARSLHPTPMRSPHEAYAIILEEVEEFWKEVMRKQSQHDRIQMRKELVEIAAMAMRAVEDLGLV